MNTLTKNIIKGVAVGLFASWIKSLVEPPLQKIGEEYFPPSEDELKLKGADAIHQPENMPPAILAKKVYQCSTGEELSDDQSKMAMPYIHYGLGAVIGAVYVEVVNNRESLALEQGLAAGAAVWALTHGSTVPALGLQGKVSEMPKSWWVWEFGSHLVFGWAMEQGRKVANRVF